MATEERRAWIMAVVAVIAYAVYVAVVAGGASYGPALLWTIGAAIVANIVLGILFAGRDPRDQRDREIARFGDTVGQSLLVVGALAALVLALVEADYFWIANAIYLGFVLSAVLGSVAKLFAYRKGFHPW
jgi:Mn2+/Fe2+ NRAMP family transporter